MGKFFRYLLFSSLLMSVYGLRSQSVLHDVDVCVYGGTSAGVIAAYTAKLSGKSVLLVTPGTHIGGLTAGGLGFTDIGNKFAITGLSRDFYRRVGAHYGKFEQWIFEPHVAENILRDYLNRAKVEVLYSHRVIETLKPQTTIEYIVVENSNSDLPTVEPRHTIRAKQYIDCSYEGDLMARAKVSYTVGREPNSQYKETYNGVQLLDKHQFPDGVDPYIMPGRPESGLLWGISTETLAPIGTGDKKVQAYNYRICITDDPANKVDITQPVNYDSRRYELLLRYLEKKPAKNLWGFMAFDKMPNRKTDINNNGPFSTDMIGMNYEYPEATYEHRKQIQAEHEAYVKGFLYFVGNDPRMPEHLRKEMKQWGYPKDEYVNFGNWSPQMYVREARRMVGEYVMTQHNCQGRETVTDGVGMAAYTMDSHNCQRILVEKNGMVMVKNEGDVQVGGFPPYPISYRSLVPKRAECTNLLVPVCLSATHIAYGSIRMEPVFMVLAQSSALAASMAIDAKVSIQEVDINALRQRLKQDPYMDGSLSEFLLDDENGQLVQWQGDWQRRAGLRGCYGTSALVDNPKSSVSGLVRFVPDIEKSGTYNIYFYLPKHEEICSQMGLSIYNGKEIKEFIIKPRDLRVEGQTSGEWIPVGEYKLGKGKLNYIEVQNKSRDGIAIADALLFVPKDAQAK